MNFKELLTTVRSEIDERGSGGFFLDSDIKRWLNEAQRNIAKKTYFLQDYKFIDNAIGEEFSLPDDFYEMHILIIANNEIKHYNRDPSGGYVIWNRVIKLNFELNDSKIELYYYRFPAKMVNDDDLPEVPDEYQDLIIKYAKYEAKLADEKPKEAQLFYQQYLDGLSDMKKEYGKQRKPTQVKVIR